MSHLHVLNRFAVMPTCELLGVAPGDGARGVTIAFLDAGFSEHPDLKGRIKARHGQGDNVWHGTQTSVVAAGDGTLSDGAYRGLAWQADVVLVAVDPRDDASILEGLEWIEQNGHRLGIQVLSISLGGEDERLNDAVDRLVARGITVVVAAGNSGCSQNPLPYPPATAPRALTVGGSAGSELYCSSYGDDGLKPEVIAPAMWVAAPLVKGTPEWRHAERLAELLALPDDQLDRPRHDLEQELLERKLVSTHYQHVDGTSFAAPLVASLAARMLALNPDLTPGAIKQILMSTADFLEGQPRLRQGFGSVNAHAALEQARSFGQLTTPRLHRGRLVFQFLEPAASQVELQASWLEELVPLERKGGLWRASLASPAPGRYSYKFLIDAERWEEDPCNPAREKDGFGGFNSVLVR